MSVIVPGEWRCPECGYMLSKRVISLAGAGTFNDARLEREACPNDGVLMVQATERDIIEGYRESQGDMLDAIDALGGSWWHIERAMPEPGQRVLVVVRLDIGAEVRFGTYRTHHGLAAPGWSTWSLDGGVAGDVTHWKKVPEIPGVDYGSGAGGGCFIEEEK